MAGAVGSVSEAMSAALGSLEGFLPLQHSYPTDEYTHPPSFYTQTTPKVKMRGSYVLVVTSLIMPTWRSFTGSLPHSHTHSAPLSKPERQSPK